MTTIFKPMLRYFACTSFAAALALSSAASAVAQTLLNKPITSPTSGKSPTNKTLSKAASAKGAVYAVTIGEDSDDPCFMEIKYRDIATSGTQSSLTFSECDGHKVGGQMTASLPSGAFVTGARICLNSGGDKLKGIQLIGGYGDCVLGAESVSGVPSSCSGVVKISGHDYQVCNDDSSSFITISCSTPITSFVERTNCQGSKHDQPDDDWEKIVSCQEGMVATGMKLRTINGSGKRKMIDGVALVCDTLIK